MRTYATILCLLLTSVPGWPAEPTLARLWFWVPPERMTEFESAYEEQVVPVLPPHGLVPSSESRRTPAASIFTRVFEFRTSAEFQDTRDAILSDSAFVQIQLRLGRTFGSVNQLGLIRSGFEILRSPAGLGKQVPAGPGQGHWSSYGVQDGLADNRVWASYRDHDGSLWFGTEGGASRYDGETFTTLTTKNGLAHNHVRAILRDGEGSLWFGTPAGVTRYDGENFVTLTTEDGLAGSRVNAIFQDREGFLWFGTRTGGVSRYDPSVGFPGSGTSRQAEQAAFTTFTVQDGLAGDNVRSIVQDQKGILWFGCARGGASRYDGKTFTTLTKEDGLAGNSVRSIIEDQKGALWFACTGGVSRYDGETFTNFTEKDGLASNSVRSIVKDRDGVLWFATWGSGVSKYDGKTFTTLMIPGGSTFNSISSIVEDREGSLWFGTWTGVGRYWGRTLTTFTEEDGLPFKDLSRIYLDRQGVVWLGSNRSGVCRYDGKTFTTFTTQDGLVSNRVFSIFEDREGSLWFGTFGGGVTRYDGKTFTSFTTRDGLGGNNVFSILEDRDGSLWFGCFGGGVSRYDPRVKPGAGSSAGSGQATFTTLTAKDGLARNSVLSAFRTGRACSGSGLRTEASAGMMARPSRPSPQRMGWLTTKCSRSSRTGKVTSGLAPLAAVSAGMMGKASLLSPSRMDWPTMTCGRSLRTDRDSSGSAHSAAVSADLTAGLFATLTTEDGLAHDFVGGVVQDQDGVLWFATLGGLTRYRMAAPTPPSVFIDGVLADRRYDDVLDIAIPSTVKLTSFEFHGASFKTRPEAMLYRHRLKGYDDWQTTSSRRVEYQNLPRGTYTFEVLAVDRDLTYSDKPATVALTVHLPYERIGLLSALGLAVGLVAWQTVRVVRRDRRLQESNQALSDANNELFSVNQELLQGSNVELRRGQAVERLRTEVQSMEQAEDFEKVLLLLTEDLKAVGLQFEQCEIDVLDHEIHEKRHETSEEGIAQFEKVGFNYVTHRLNPEGEVSARTYRVAAPFPDVIERTIERFIAGEPWQGTSEGMAIVEVPAGSYGRLRLTASDRDSFKDDEVTTLREFAQAVALGYARYLDIREIQEQTQRKSAFLASMSHELRTPMNAIKGFTDLVLRRGKDELSDRNQKNLQRVTQASDHLLAMINDLLDLSKIEAGRMDVNPESFSVKSVVALCCDTVSPLIQEGVELRHDVADDIGEANTDKARLQQMIINLLSNAIKFTEAGTVTVTARRQQAEGSSEKENLTGASHVSPTHDSRPTTHALVVSVSDTGKGIPADELPTIFDEYRQAEGSESSVQKGTGLGLSITKKFAELLGGTIGVESEVGKGSTFTVRVPVDYGLDRE